MKRISCENIAHVSFPFAAIAQFPHFPCCKCNARAKRSAPKKKGIYWRISAFAHFYGAHARSIKRYMHIHSNLIVAAVKHLVQGHRQIVGTWVMSGTTFMAHCAPKTPLHHPTHTHFWIDLMQLCLFISRFLCINY